VTELALNALEVVGENPYLSLPGVALARRWIKLLLRPATVVRWGSLRRTTPVSACYGFDRGLPVDRFYVERFLARFAGDVRGRVLEVRDAAYTRRYGDGEVTSSEIVDIDAENPEATLVADLAEPGSLPHEQYDCAIVTQTLQYVSDPGAALRNIWRSLAPGGVGLLTVPSLSRVDPDLAAVDHWRFTERGLDALLRQACPGAQTEVVGFGNVLVAVAFLMGLAVPDLHESELEHEDKHFPVVACARVRKPG
jgi:SAM-dependent methyltransferase